MKTRARNRVLGPTLRCFRVTLVSRERRGIMMNRIGLRGIAVLACASSLLGSPVAAQQPPTAPLPRAEMWMLLPLFEANRPVITERKLSGAEKAEAKKISKLYLGSRATGAVRTIAALARMRELASSGDRDAIDRKSTRLNSSHRSSSYAVLCL